jgi:hypothetical protein
LLRAAYTNVSTHKSIPYFGEYLVGIKSILLIILSTLSVNVFAALVNTPSGAIPKNLHVYNNNGDTYVDHVQGDCSGTRYYINPNHTKYDAIISILLAAQMGNKKVVLRYDSIVGCSQGQIVGVYLQE